MANRVPCHSLSPSPLSLSPSPRRVSTLPLAPKQAPPASRCSPVLPLLGPSPPSRQVAASPGRGRSRALQLLRARQLSPLPPLSPADTCPSGLNPLNGDAAPRPSVTIARGHLGAPSLTPNPSPCHCYHGRGCVTWFTPPSRRHLSAPTHAHTRRRTPCLRTGPHHPELQLSPSSLPSLPLKP